MTIAAPKALTSIHPFLDDAIDAALMHRAGGWEEGPLATCHRVPASSAHPCLDAAMSMHGEEFGDPAYVDAIIAHYSQESMGRIYGLFWDGPDELRLRLRWAERRWERGVGGTRLGELTVAQACGRLCAHYDEVLADYGVGDELWQDGDDEPCDGDPRSYQPATPLLDFETQRRLVEVTRALTSPYESVDRRRQRVQCGMTADWDSNANAMHLPPAATTRTMLRFCLLPQGMFEEGLLRLGVDESLVERSNGRVARLALLQTTRLCPGSQADEVVDCIDRFARPMAALA